MKKISGKPCPTCGEIVETYYESYCPKCDIQKIIIYKKKNSSYNLIPILRYGVNNVSGFNYDKMWDHLVYNNRVQNDTYMKYDVSSHTREDKIMKQVLDLLKIDYSEGNEVLFYVSW